MRYFNLDYNNAIVQNITYILHPQGIQEWLGYLKTKFSL